MGTFSRRWLVGAGGVAALLVVAVALTFQNTRRLHEDAGWVAHTHEVMDTLEEVIAHLREAEAMQRAYIITGDQACRPAIAAAIGTAKQSLERARVLTEDNSQQQARFPEVRRRIEDVAGRWCGAVEVRQEQGFSAARRVVVAGDASEAMTDLQALLRRMQDTEKVLLRDRAGKSQQTYGWALVTGLLIGVAALAGVIAFTALMGRHQAALKKHEEELEQRVIDRTHELHEALANVKRLQGLLPICAWCKKVRDDGDYWHEVEHYIAAHTEARFTHGICPKCMDGNLKARNEVAKGGWPT